MIQAKFSVQEEQASFLSDYGKYGFKDKSAMLRAAIDRFRKNIEFERLRASAELYGEVYATDDDLSELTETAISGWPE